MRWICPATRSRLLARNVADHGLDDRITLHHGDLFAPLGERRYDLIISNPPYVDAEGMAELPPECRAEPKLAFDGGADGLDIVRPILDEAAAHLTPEGGLLCEIGRGRENVEAAYPQLPLLWLDTEDFGSRGIFRHGRRPRLKSSQHFTAKRQKIASYWRSRPAAKLVA